ncbi:NF-kappa-B inhibitor cactus-like [Physella acuta]|uniref:NF-kappa-B inhibitor cactus-like n=1 Tax=Physella acuta TaxID=109671 RepID=UPI0027DE9187|nr:NF-kappa-B inhibitor cactus-like [Physella acuta]
MFSSKDEMQHSSCDKFSSSRLHPGEEDPLDSAYFSEERQDSAYSSIPHTHNADTEKVPHGSGKLNSISDSFGQLSLDASQTKPACVDTTSLESGCYSIPEEIPADPPSDSWSKEIKFVIPIEQRVQLFEGDRDGDNKLHLSILKNSTNLSLLIIKLAPSYYFLNYCNFLRQTPLHLAVLTNQPTVVRKLLCAGAEATAQDRDGNTALHLACREGYEDIVKQLLMPVQYEETQENTYDIPFQRLPQDMSIRNFEGETCLHIAVRHSRIRIVKMLLDSGADINIGDGKSGRTALHIASEQNLVELVLLILRRSDTEVNVKNYAGLTPVQLAYGRGHEKSVDLICRHIGAYDVSLSDNSDAEDYSDDDMSVDL